ncbi:MAG: AAA family ATPase [Erysipelotrichaceae bacterium]|nr:AAA family ATPase [Erysipelotrichaceae bacterium]
MYKIAFYGKGGIGKSTIVSNLAAILAKRGYKVLQIGCDPKADSTMLLRHNEPIKTVMAYIREHPAKMSLDDVIKIGHAGVVLAEAGGPLPGLGCAGRGVITALETLDEMGVYETYQPDIVLYDVLGDVVCGGFAMPMRRGYADDVYIITSGENMSIHAAANIAMALDTLKNRGYARLAGMILNERQVEREKEKVSELCDDFHTEIVASIPHDDLIPASEDEGMILMERYPDSHVAQAFETLADSIIETSHIEAPKC